VKKHLSPDVAEPGCRSLITRRFYTADDGTLWIEITTPRDKMSPEIEERPATETDIAYYPAAYAAYLAALDD
jgi:hypothetical protein